MENIRRNGYFPGLVLVASILLAGCGKQQEYAIVEIRGADAAYNISRSWIYFGSYAGQDGTVSVPAGKGDLLYAINEEYDLAAFLMYDKHTGNNPVLSFDTLYPSATFVNGVIHSLNLTLDSLPPELPPPGRQNNLAGLKTLYLDLPLSLHMKEWLDTTFEGRRSIDLVLEGEDRYNQVHGLLEKFKPQWVYMPQLAISERLAGWSHGLKNISMLVVSREVLQAVDPAEDLASLVSLIIIEDSDEPLKPLDLKRIRTLRNLSVIDFLHVDMSWFSETVNLESLFLVNADSVSSKNELSGLTRLKALGLTVSDWDDDLPVIGGLQWISFPRNIPQESFANWCSQHRNIKVLEIIGNNTLTDLGPLENLTGLSTLMLDASVAPLDPLRELKQLELLVIEQDVYDDPEAGIAELKDSLPGTRVVPGGGFCLGSGWILLLIPVILLLLSAGSKKQGASIRRQGE